MSRITLIKGLLMNLAAEIEPGRREYLSKEVAYQQLKRFTGQDFGFDLEKWQKWLVNNPIKIKDEDRS